MRKDNFDILARTTDLLTEIKTTEDCKQADRELMNFLEKQIKRSKTIEELLEIWSDGCKGLELLRLRFNLIKAKFEARPDDERMLGALGVGMSWDAEFDHDNVFADSSAVLDLTREAYSKDFDSLEADKTALASMLLLDYLYRGNYDGLPFYEVIKTTLFLIYVKSFRGLDNLSTVKYKEYFYDFKLEDRKFVEIFAAGLKDLLSEGQSILSLEMQRLLNGLLVSVWTGMSECEVFRVYNELAMVLGSDKTELGVRSELMNKLHLSKGFAVKRDYGEQEITYKVNVEALESLATMIKDLELDKLDENKLILDLIAQRQV